MLKKLRNDGLEVSLLLMLLVILRKRSYVLSSHGLLKLTTMKLTFKLISNLILETNLKTNFMVVKTLVNKC